MHGATLRTVRIFHAVSALLFLLNPQTFAICTAKSQAASSFRLFARTRRRNMPRNERVRCPEREFRRRARGSRDVARPAAGGFLTRRKARQGNARCSAAQAAEDLQSAQAGESGEGEPGWRQPGAPAESAPLSRADLETLLATFPWTKRRKWRGGERAGAILNFHPPDRSGSGRQRCRSNPPNRTRQCPPPRASRRPQGL